MSHFHHRRLYRSRKGVLFGVCTGFAEYFDLSVFWTRLIVLAAFVLTGFWPVGALYILAALLMKKDPYRSVGAGASSWRPRQAPPQPGRASKGGSLDERIRNLEDIVTSKAYDWDARLRSS